LGAARLWHVGYGGAYLLATLTAAGFLFAWWARIALGKLWSVQITRKEDHHVVDTGPYAIVRHPIYTGLIAATLFTAAAQATIAAVIGAALITFGLWLKARMEERFLIQELGAEAYTAYSARVPMLVPFGPR
jgi:protein-S-isoprenylcysteine O-methyltransferase Ste14